MKNRLNRRFRVSCWAIPLIALSFRGNAQKATPKVAHAALDCGAIAGQVLRCPQLGFTYRVPFGWVDRTDEMQSTPEDAAAEPSHAAPRKTDDPASVRSVGKTLLAVFQRPPAAPGATINSAVIIAAEPSSEYPKVKTAADYLGALADIAEQRGLKMDGDPYGFGVGARQLVRGDFSAANDKTTVHQTSLVTIEKGYILSFTFVSSSDDEIDDLIAALSFGTRPPTHSSHPR